MILSLGFNLPVAGIMSAFMLSNLAGKVIIIVLFLGSIFAWSIMLTKFKDLRQARIASNRFVSVYRAEGHPVSLFLKRQKFDGSPLYRVYEKSCIALGASLEARGADAEDLFMGGVGSNQKLEQYHVVSLKNVMERNVTDEVVLLEGLMGLLALATTAAPFLGLLGTVWGVMESFEQMVNVGTAMLSAVAPGISGALLTTVVGLLVALPSSIAYNLLAEQIKKLTVQMDNFTQEFISDVERHYL